MTKLNKKFGLGMILVVLVTVALAGLAVAFGPMGVDSGYVKTTTLIPKKAKSGCSTLTAGRATSVTVPATGSLQMRWKAFSATDGTAVKVKRSLDSNTAYIPATDEDNLGLERDVSNVVFTRYTGNAAVTVCYEKN